jgi:hypothetical protein
MRAETVNSLSFIADSSFFFNDCISFESENFLFWKEFAKTDVPLHVELLRLNSVHHLLEAKDVLLSEV